MRNAQETILKKIILIFSISLILLIASFVIPVHAQNDCDFSGAEYVQIQRLNPRSYRMGNYYVPRRSSFYDLDSLSIPATWEGESTWVGYENGGITEAHAVASHFAYLKFFDLNGNWIHWIEIKADEEYIYAILMPGSLRDWHGCKAIRQPRSGEIESYLNNRVG